MPLTPEEQAVYEAAQAKKLADYKARLKHMSQIEPNGHKASTIIEEFVALEEAQEAFLQPDGDNW